MRAVSVRASHVIPGVGGLNSPGFCNLCGEAASKDCVSLIYAGRFSLVRKTELEFCSGLMQQGSYLTRRFGILIHFNSLSWSFRIKKRSVGT